LTRKYRHYGGAQSTFRKIKLMNRSVLLASVSAWLFLGLTGPLIAASPTVGAPPANPPAGTVAAAEKPATACLTELRSFESQMQKDGYWVGGSDLGYGYPMLGYGYGPHIATFPIVPMTTAASPPAVAPAQPIAKPESNAGDGPKHMALSGYYRGRPGYEVRTLIASAAILGRHGQQQPCESVLSASREIYARYLVDLRDGKITMANRPGWQQQQIATAQPIGDMSTAFRSDQLVGIEVRSPQDVALGSVDDIVMDPQSGKIAYLVIGRGGIFGFDEKYVPVPWADFKITAGQHLLVLDATKRGMDGAPQVDHDRFGEAGNFDQESQKIDTYWKSQLPKTANK
jgi:sporulation protein YlmC with PRC-barrel domain